MALARLSLFVCCAAWVACSSTPPAATQCLAGQTACGDNCADLKTDDANCGTCGKTCEAGTACANSACFPKGCVDSDCDAASVCYQSRCAERACVGVICPDGQTCSQGVCLCGGDSRTCGTACSNLKLDDANCGTCGVACGPGTSCAGGTCLPDDCSAADCDPASVCFANTCREKACVGVVCPGGLTCRSGQCGCPEGQVVCAARCTSLPTDTANCGACGRACASGTACAGGECFNTACGSMTCDPLSVCQGGACVERACVGVACGGDKTCTAGQCLCPAGLSDCGACVSTNNSPAHCGGCGHACGANETCMAGTCVANPCTGGKQLCAGSCTDTQTDPAHCGACGAACGGGRVCVGAQCSCPTGLTFCGGSCVNLTNDMLNCGQCGRSCSGGTCAASVCSCPSGTQLCGGTCANPYTDALNCGQCGRGCGTGQACNGGTCQCAAGFSFCNGACVATSTDSQNCGGCNVICAINKFCNNSACTDMFTCQPNFITAPADCPLFPLDPSRCGMTSVAGSTPLNGSIPFSMSMATPFSIAQSEKMTVSGTVACPPPCVTSGNEHIAQRNFMGVEIGGGDNVAPFIGTNPVFFTVPGSPYACRHPVDLYQLVIDRGPVIHNLNLQRLSTSGKWNTGGATAATAAPLTAVAPPDGGTARVCDQVCGYLSNTCGDNREFYRLTVPPKKGAVVEIQFTTTSNNSTNFKLDLQTANGGFICRLVDATSTQPGVYRARLVNNTDVPQPLNVVPFLDFRDFHWNFALAVEP